MPSSSKLLCQVTFGNTSHQALEMANAFAETRALNVEFAKFAGIHHGLEVSVELIQAPSEAADVVIELAMLLYFCQEAPIPEFVDGLAQDSELGSGT